MSERTENNAVSKAGSAARKLHGTAQLVRGAVTADFVAAVNGAAKVVSPQVIAAILCIAFFFAILPLLIIFSLPQVLFNWGTLADNELTLRHEHAEEIRKCYSETSELTSEYLDSLADGAPGGVTINEDEDNVLWLIAIDAVRNNQDVMKMNERSIKELIRKSYTVSEGAGENGTTLSINSKNHYELMNELGFAAEGKNYPLAVTIEHNMM